jgi:tripartite-type tricarboxylate transporter receptor subunit TctC
MPRNILPQRSALIAAITLTSTCLAVTFAPTKAGRLKLFALTGKTRHPRFSEVPTFAEAGLTDYAPVAWQGILAPASTPTAIAVTQGNAISRRPPDSSSQVSGFLEVG